MNLFKTWLDRIVLVCIVIIVFTIGYFAGKDLNWTVFDLDYSITLVDVVSLIATFLSLVVTIWVAHYVGNVIERNNERSKNEKLMMSTRIEALENLIKEASGTVTNEGSESDAVNKSFKKIGTTILGIKGNLNIIGMNLNTEVTAIFQDFGRLKHLATYYTNPRANINSAQPVRFENGSYVYSAERLVDIEFAFSALSHKIFDLLLKVNRYPS